uniref:Folylpolyglutamate synthase n=1 Tax=Trichuris muris TaxID=70415 RepID=A0A5S6R3Y1_TRIMR
MTAYKDAIRALNALQIPRILPPRALATPGDRLLAFETHVEESGLHLDDLDKLNVVHVAGTKGKGSCCAFVESILRNKGFKTGFFSSPHMLCVRERFRINGIPISEERFVELFWRIHKCLCRDASKLEMVRYFQFLTIMAFHLFLESKVDVAIIEVGVGGTYDSTNVIRNPVVCGITRLDYDHTVTLGSHIKDIAWNKAGILKPGSVAVTVPQEEAAFKVIAQRAVDVKCSLYVCPSWDDYCIRHNAQPVVVGIAGKHQLENASLAVQLVRLWSFRTGNAKEENEDRPAKFLSTLKAGCISDNEALGLSRCTWPGRSQKVTANGINFYLDGAHTLLSMQCCVDWFHSSSDKVKRSFRILIFHCTKGRQPEQLLPPLITLGFQYALFSPPRITLSDDSSCDVASLTTITESTEEAVSSHHAAWIQLTSSMHDCPPCITRCFKCVNDAYDFVNGITASVPVNDQTSIDVLVTGSLYLVGAFLSLLDPDLSGTISTSS